MWGSRRENLHSDLRGSREEEAGKASEEKDIHSGFKDE